MTSEALLHRVEDGVSIISLNRDEAHNAIDYEMSERLTALWNQAIFEDDSRAILVRGEGRSFCAGRDTRVLGSRPPGLSDFAHVSKSQRTKVLQLDSQKPIVAAVQGAAIGAGAELALRSDIRVFAEDVRLALPEIQHGVITDGGGSVITAALAGPSRAKYLLMTGDRIDAQRCYEWGLCDFVVPRAELDAFALDLAKRIAAQPPVHLAMAKQLCDSGQGAAIRRGLREELVAITALYRTADAQEARAARKEKRKPRYTGL